MLLKLYLINTTFFLQREATGLIRQAHWHGSGDTL
jgi:hypothetical protein